MAVNTNNHEIVLQAFFSFSLIYFRNIINASPTSNFQRAYGLELFIKKQWMEILLKTLKLETTLNIQISEL